MENLIKCGVFELKSGEVAREVIDALIKSGYKVSLEKVGLIYNQYEVFKERDR